MNLGGFEVTRGHKKKWKETRDPLHFLGLD